MTTIRVIATGAFKRKNIAPKELGRIPEEGEEFEVSIPRYFILCGNNGYATRFVELPKEPKKETPKRGRRSKRQD